LDIQEAAGFLAGLREDRKKDRREHRDDRYHHKQLDQRKRPPGPPRTNRIIAPATR
jgi:hypothetical protein